MEECDLMWGVVGVGSYGIRALGSMMKENLQDVYYIAVDSDADTLQNSPVPTKIFIDPNTVNIDGCSDARLSDEIKSALKRADMVMLVSGNDTETDKSTIRIVADIVKEIEAQLFIGLIGLPFPIEGKCLTESADTEISNLVELFTSLIVLPRHGSPDFSPPLTGSMNEYKVIIESVRGITSLFDSIRFMSLDFGDVVRVLSSAYPVTFGFGEAAGSERALEAAHEALRPLSYGGVDIGQATGILTTMSGSTNMTMEDYDSVCQTLNDKVNEDAKVTIAIVRDDSMGDAVKVAVYLSNITK